MLKRKIVERLKEWKEKENHNPLIVKGCRQCGKTYSVRRFAEENYKSVVYINFFENPSYSSIFSGSMNVDDIMIQMSAMLNQNIKIEPRNTCIILDEIQECPNARTALKFFKLDGRYDVICTGSLLGIRGYREQTASIPVGYETEIKMYPLDFEEFLWANGVGEDVIALLKKCYETHSVVPEAIHQRMRELLLRYVVVGGMPAVVNTFVDTKNMTEVIGMQRDIVNSYRDDMIKYAAKEDKSKIMECFNSIPRQLSKENKKFQYSLISKKATAAKFEGSIQWIEDAGIINKCHNLTITELPLDGNSLPDSFKIYMADIGLLVCMLEDGTQSDILQGNLHTYKGAIFENLLADILCKMGRKLYYFRKESGLEIDFVLRLEGECVLLECKATNGNAKSLKTILAHPEKYGVKRAIKLGDYNIGVSDNGIVTMPHYMAMFLDKA